MKNKNNIIGSVLIYTLFLINIAMIFALVVFNIAGVVIDNNEYQHIARKLSNNILYKGNLAIKYVRSLNSNGSWYTDNISCPTLTMSGNTLSGSVATTMIVSWVTKYCLGTYNWLSVYLFHNNTYTWFTWAEYQGDQIYLSGGIGLTNFTTDNTLLSFSLWGLAWIDGYDDNFNSDDYKPTSTGTLAYPNSFQDDDNLPRRLNYFYVPPDSGYVNIFFNNQNISDFISGNTNNDDGVNYNLWDVGTGRVYLDIDKYFWIKLVKFSKSRFDNFKELIALETFESLNNEWRIWFIQDDGSVSTWWLVTTGNEYDFDFTNNYYGIFLRNFSTGTLLFQMKAYTSTGAAVYLTPLDDDDPNVIKYLWNDIIIDSEGKYVYNQFEIVWLK